MKPKKLAKARFGMHSHIWYWFMIFLVAVFLLVWVFQIVFLQTFYESMKVNDIIQLADTMLTVYQKDGYEDIYTKLAVENDMCIEVRDRYGRVVYSKDMMGINCVIHGLNNQTMDIIRMVKADGDGIVYGKQVNPATHSSIMIYASVIGEKDFPEGYLVLNTPLVPVTSTLDILKRQLFVITLTLIVLAFIISYIVSKRLSDPIVRITKDAEQLAHGRYDIKFKGGGYSEADRLARTLTYASHEINRVDTMQRDLIANASHDLRTPLTMLKAYAEMIRDLSGDNPVKRAEHLQVIIEETDRLTMLVNDILDLSKMENGTMTLECSAFDMEIRLKEIVERYRGLSAVSGYTFHMQTDGEAQVYCDAGKIERVICNLINNAMNYSGDSKQIYITQSHTPEGIRISVRDEGAGMDQATLSRIFDKYYRSENYQRQVMGTGLGLSIVKAVLRLHDYAFGVESTVGVGSDFWFIIHPESENKNA